MIITHILKFYREDIYGLIERETVSMLFNFHNSLLPEDPEDRLYRRRCLVQKMFGTEPFCSLAPLYNSLRDYRNDINHAGLVGGNKKNKADPLGEEKFEKKLSLVFSGVIDILQRS